jgi:hypothetical protein
MDVTSQLRQKPAQNTINSNAMPAATGVPSARLVGGLTAEGFHIKVGKNVYFIQRKFIPAFGFSLGKIMNKRLVFEEGTFLQKIQQHDLHSVRFIGPDKKKLSKSVNTALKYIMMKDIKLVKNQVYPLATQDDMAQLAQKN